MHALLACLVNQRKCYWIYIYNVSVVGEPTGRVAIVGERTVLGAEGEEERSRAVGIYY